MDIRTKANGEETMQWQEQLADLIDLEVAWQTYDGVEHINREEFSYRYIYLRD